jgi:hypothetical protein
MAIISRFSPGINQDNTLRTVTQDYQTPALGSGAVTLQLNPYQQVTTVIPVMTNVTSLTINVSTGVLNTPPYVNDVLQLIYNAPAANCTVTYGSGVAVSSATQVIAQSKYGSIMFQFNGVFWVEIARSVTI